MMGKVKKLIQFFQDWDNQSHYLKWMLGETRPFMGSLMLVLFINFLITITGIGSTVITKYIIDGATGSGPVFTVPGITVLIILTAASIALSAVIGIISSYINERYAFSIRSKVYDHLLHGVWQKIMSFHSGDILTRLTSDVERVANGIASIIPEMLFLLVRLIIAFGVLYYYDHFLALTALLLGPVGVLLSLLFSGKLKKYQVELNKTESEYRSFMQETIENISVTKAFKQEPFCNEKLASIRDKRLRLVMKRNKLNTAMSVCIRVVFSCGYLIAFCWSIYRLSTNSITYGTMNIFLSLVAQIQGPIIGLGSIIPQFISVLASTGRILDLNTVDTESAVEKGIDVQVENIGMNIQDMTFCYNREIVLENFNVNIKPNDIVGVVGYSGSGKTTLVRLILSLVSPQKGKLVFYDDTGATEEASAQARRFISYVPQGNTLISGTIADNLRAGNREATDEQMWQALKIADCLSFVKELDDGLDTRIGENALGLSEGQAQRISIARAVIKAAPILILDEATSALDAQTEEKVIRGMCESKVLHTCIIITHRRSMLQYCTRALEIDNSRLNELQL